MNLTKLILSQLLHNEDYTRKVFPFLKDDYFDNPIDQAIFRVVKYYLEKYNKRPTQDVLRIELQGAKGLNETSFRQCNELIESLKDEPQEIDWLVNTTEKWCKDRAIYNGLVKSLAIAQNKDEKNDPGEIVHILEDAISVSFDSHIGHDYFEDADARYDSYHRIESKIAFDIDILNKITNGGLPNKILMLWMGGIGVGKTATMCSQAAAAMMAGKNVLYITLEMSEEEITKRIDANLLDTSMTDLAKLPKTLYDQKINRVRKRTPGKLKMKEYPTAGGNVNHFRHLLHELRFKKKFQPDIIFIDYLNICSSARVKMSQKIGLYEYVMCITQEVRGFAIENNVPIVSATQLNREGFTSSDPGMEHIAESFGTGATADLMLVLTITEELESINQIMVKQIKNRFGDIHKYKRFIIGRDLDKMRMYNVEQASKTDNGPIMDNMIPPDKADRKKILESWT